MPVKVKKAIPSRRNNRYLEVAQRYEEWLNTIGKTANKKRRLATFDAIADNEWDKSQI